MRQFVCAVAITANFFAVGPGSAEDFPSRPITLVVPFAAGGPTDSLARSLADRMGAVLGQTMIIENVTGAAGNIGVGRVARANPDGYTLSIGNWTSHVTNGAVYALKYDLLNDLQPITMLPSNPQLIVAKKAVPAEDLAGLIDWLKRSRMPASAGTGGPGTAAHISGVYFQDITGVNLQFVPYRGTGPAVQDLVAGNIDLMFDQSSNSLPHVRAGLIKAYAVTAKTRLTSAPDIPTVDEVGLPEFYVSVWHGLWAPAGVPAKIIAKLNTAAVKALGDPALQKRLADLGLEMPPRERQTPEGFAAFQKAEVDKWWPLVRAANLRAD
jgi:tripartite-type tricarboxylate transporter receptor subunit TctC